MADNPSNDVKNRFAERFEKDENSKPDKNGQRSKAAKNEKDEQNGKVSKGGQTVNIKKSWTNHSVYLPDELADTLGRQYKYLDLELDEEFGLSIQKTRHYYPLIVKLGLERLDQIDSKDIKERLEQLENPDDNSSKAHA